MKDLVLTSVEFTPKLVKSVSGTPKGCAIVIELAEGEFAVTVHPPTPFILLPEGSYKAVILLTAFDDIFTTSL